MESNRYAPPVANVEDGPALSPPLWNPNAAANWCLLFSPIFGTWLHMKNWQALGEMDKAKSARLWLEISIFIVIGLSLIGSIPQVAWVSRFTWPISIALLIAWYFAAARPQARYVAQRFGASYARKGWGEPILWAILSCVAYVVVVFIAVTVATSVAMQMR